LNASKKDIRSVIAKAHKSPGYRYLHFDPERVLFDVFDGMEDICSTIPVTEKTSFNAFSTTKTITSAAILSLVQDGRINIEDSAGKYLSEHEIPAHVKIKHLLNHQSGISNPIPLKWIHFKEEHGNFEPSDFADQLLKSKMNFKKHSGVKFSYSNLNYLLLGKIIEEVTDQSYTEFVTRRILDPIEDDGNLMGFEYPENNHAIGYHKNNGFQRLLLKLLVNKKGLLQEANSDWISLHPFYVNGTAYGGLFCHPKSMVRYCQRLMPGNESLLSESTKKWIYNDSPTENGQSTGMSMGWFLGRINGHNYICHAGGGAGYYSEIRVYPEMNKGSVIMFNSSGMKDKRVLDSIDKQFIGNG